MRGLLKKLLRPPFNEVVELTHVKVYIADDSLVLTGANLSQNYFTERQDRYMVVRDAATCDFFEELVDAISDSCSQLTPDGIVPNPLRETPDAFVAAARSSMTSLLARHPVVAAEAPDLTGANAAGDTTDTVLYPLLQMGPWGIRNDEECTHELLRGLPDQVMPSTPTFYSACCPLLSSRLVWKVVVVFCEYGSNKSLNP